MTLDTEPNRPLEANCYTREEGALPRRECQSVREGKEETVVAVVATKIGATGEKWRLSMGNICLTLGLVPSSCPVLGSYTIHQK